MDQLQKLQSSDSNITTKTVAICLSNISTSTKIEGTCPFNQNMKDVIGLYVEYFAINPTPTFSATNANNGHYGMTLFLKSSILSTSLQKGFNLMKFEGEPADQYNMNLSPSSDVIGVSVLSNKTPLTTFGTNEQTKFDNSMMKKTLLFDKPRDLQYFDWRIEGWPKTGQTHASANGSVEIVITFLLKNDYANTFMYSAKDSI